MVDVESKLSDCEYGLVMLGEHQLTKQTVAVRIVIKDRLQKEGKVRRLAKQIALQRKLHHSTIVRLF
jgi:serine/threonine protein kinase